MARIWDAVIVGAGPAGILVAEELMRAGAQVLLLDAGPRVRYGGDPPEVNASQWAYRVTGRGGEWEGRVRAVGGRSLHWGGWAFRFPDVVFRTGGWPYSRSALAGAYAQVERRLGVVKGKLDPRYRRAAAALGIRCVPKSGSFLTGSAGSASGRPPTAPGTSGERMTWERPWTGLDSTAARRVRPRTVAVKLEHDGRRVEALHVIDAVRGRGSTIRARAHILAASPIETSRLLLASDVPAPGIGRDLTAHLVSGYLLVEPRESSLPPASRTNRFPGMALFPRHVNTGPGTERPYRGGFSLEVAGPYSLAQELPWVGAALEIPPRDWPSFRVTLIHALGETFGHPRRYVDLDPETTDTFGRAVPRLHLSWTAAERRQFRDMNAACESLAEVLSVPDGAIIRYLDSLTSRTIGHEAGTCLMGREDSTPCDAHGRLRGLENVWIADASVFPTSGDRHPTLTVLAHAIRAAASVRDSLARRR
jgi:choline dehydrogenase-like flavoprotein